MNLIPVEAVIASNSMVKTQTCNITEKQQNNMTVVPLKMKLRGRHFDTNEVIKAEHPHRTSRMHLKHRINAQNDAYVQKGTTSRVRRPVGPKLDFDQMAAVVPEIMVGHAIFNMMMQTISNVQ
jgi:hypothetical protein